MTSVYNIFFNSILNNGRNVLETRLKYDGTQYQIDFEDLQKKLSNPQTTLLILCNPHNPVGKVWDRETLQRIGDLCAKYHVFVLSDEIHCDLTKPGLDYIPFASVSDSCRNREKSRIFLRFPPMLPICFGLTAERSSAVQHNSVNLYAVTADSAFLMEMNTAMGKGSCA